MIHYHGLPITPATVANYAVQAGHAFVSFAHPDQVGTAIEVCQSFALDNGAFSAWKSGKPIKDWTQFYDWALNLKKVPSCDFAVIPDIIDGTESDNDALLKDCPLPHWFGSPVWHLHESLERLEQLANTYNIYTANLELNQDLFSYALIGWKPRQYMVNLNLDSTSQVSLYQQFLGTKGTKEMSMLPLMMHA